MSLKETKSYKVRRYFIQPESVESGTIKLDEKVSAVLLGDFYLSPAISENQCYDIYQKLIKIEPDLIVLHGNLVASPTELFDEETVTKLKNTLKMCSRIAPTAAVFGSRDFIIPTVPGVEMDVEALWSEIFTECNVEILKSEWLEVGPFRLFGFFQDVDFFLDSKNRPVKNLKIMEQQLAELEFEPAPDKINWFIANSYEKLPRKIIKILKNFDLLSFVASRSDSKILSTDANLIIAASLVGAASSASLSRQLLNPLRKGEITEIIFEPKTK